MKNKFKSAVVLILALCVVFTAVQSYAKLASPPPQLTSIFKDIAEFESTFKADKWDEALSAAGRIDRTFKQMLPQLKKEIKGEPERDFQAIMNGMRQSIRQKDHDGAQRQFVELHKYLFTLIGNYDYKRPPVFTLINKYVAEAEEALEKKRYSRVVSELDEIIVLFSYAETHLENRSAKRRTIDEIKTKLKDIRAAGLNKKKDVVETEIQKLKKMLAEIVR